MRIIVLDRYTSKKEACGDISLPLNPILRNLQGDHQLEELLEGFLLVDFDDWITKCILSKNNNVQIFLKREIFYENYFKNSIETSKFLQKDYCMTLINVSFSNFYTLE